MKPKEATSIAYRCLTSRAKGWPIVVSFEVTHSCVADCRHCDKGGLKSEDRLMDLHDYRLYSRELLPTICQLSGGEPLLRSDLEDIVRALKRPSGLPLVVCVSNGWLFSEERYLSLMGAGVSMFSFSLDFPDGRHDDFRRIPGLYAKLDELLPHLVKTYKRGNIVLNAAITHANFRDIPGLVEQAERWGVEISFSAYSSLRTGDRSLCIDSPEDLAILEENFHYLFASRKRSRTVCSSDYVLRKTLEFFKNGGVGGCMAGERFLVVRPDGLINACSMFPERRYRTREEAFREFRLTNTCDQCYVSIRATTERPLKYLISDNILAPFHLPD